MAGIADVPQNFINKAGIAKRIGISRVTVDRVLKKIQKDKALSSRLTVTKVKEGKRTLYFYDPSDIDACFAEVQKTKRPSSASVQPLKKDSAENAYGQSNKEYTDKIESLEAQVALLKQNNEDLRNSMRLIEDKTKKSWWSKLTG